MWMPKYQHSLDTSNVLFSFLRSESAKTKHNKTLKYRGS